MKYLSLFAGIFLIVVICFGWGFAVVEYRVFPANIIYPIMEEIKAYVEGGGESGNTLQQKVVNDMGLRPDRVLVDLWQKQGRPYKPLAVPGLRDRREEPLIYTKSPLPYGGYILVFGTMDFEEGLHGAILLDEAGSVVHRWAPLEQPVMDEIEAYNDSELAREKQVTYQDPVNTFPHGLAVMRDGSIVYNDGDYGNGMRRVDFCSRPVWIKLGEFNHVVQGSADQEGVWAMDGADQFHEVSARSGETLRIIKAIDVWKHNDSMDVLGIRRSYGKGLFFEEKWHFNDIEPLPRALAGAFPMFRPGDLLISSRSLNLLMVMDPASLDIKWWRVGATSRQHDPDWQPGGTISVYDNRMRDKQYDTPLKYSRIVSINPRTYETRALYDGGPEEFYSNIRGRHQVLANGDILIASSMQGRIMLVDARGETRMEFINKYDDRKSLLVSEAVWLPEGYFDQGVMGRDCAKAPGPGWKAGAAGPEMHYVAGRRARAEEQTATKEGVTRLRSLPLGQGLGFSNGRHILFEGWSHEEEQFRWSENRSAWIHFKIPDEMAGKGLTLRLRLHTLKTQRVDVLLNGQPQHHYQWTYGKPQWVSIPLSPDSAFAGVNTVELRFPDARTPGGGDQRALAIALYDVEFTD